MLALEHFMSLLSRPAQPCLADRHDDARLCSRIQAEFREMPGLTLTLPQAARLFNLDLDRCQQVLDALVDDGYIVTNGRTFASAQGGRRSA